jgi:HEAT repeat protein
MSQPAGAPDTFSPGDALPPVEPPSAGFILQLFVVPAVIVSVVVLVWLLFTWLAQMGANPDKYIEGLSRNNESRWQSAAALADLLNSPGNAALKHDKKLAAKLAAKLDEELATGSMDEKLVTLRVFLCRALGEFQVVEVVPVLVRATDRDDPREIAARRAALEALAVVASNVPEVRDAPPRELMRALSTAAADGDPAIRSAAAFTLGVLGGEAANRQLARMLDDPYADVRYNAATGIARQGDARAAAVLSEMLALDPQDVVVNEAEIKNDNPEAWETNVELAREAKHSLILANALRAAHKLHTKNATADLTSLRDAAQRLVEGDVPEGLLQQARQIARELQERPAPIEAQR